MVARNKKVSEATEEENMHDTLIIPSYGIICFQLFYDCELLLQENSESSESPNEVTRLAVNNFLENVETFNHSLLSHDGKIPSILFVLYLSQPQM